MGLVKFVFVIKNGLAIYLKMTSHFFDLRNKTSKNQGFSDNKMGIPKTALQKYITFLLLIVTRN